MVCYFDLFCCAVLVFGCVRGLFWCLLMLWIIAVCYLLFSCRLALWFGCCVIRYFVVWLFAITFSVSFVVFGFDLLIWFDVICWFMGYYVLGCAGLRGICCLTCVFVGVLVDFVAVVVYGLLCYSSCLQLVCFAGIWLVLVLFS